MIIKSFMKKIFLLVISFLMSLSFINLTLCLKSTWALQDETPTDTVPSRNYTVVIDPGHGGTDPGSIGYKTKVHEDELNLKMSKLLKQKLESAGINVILTRETNNSLIHQNFFD